MNWPGWPLDRVVILFIGLAYLLVGIQVALLHYRQNFHHKAMWSPIVSSPLLFASGILLAFYNAGWTVNLFFVLMVIGAVIGLVGFYFHWRGVGVRVGGYELRNFLIGPPIIMPLLFTALAVLGMIAVLW